MMVLATEGKVCGDNRGGIAKTIGRGSAICSAMVGAFVGISYVLGYLAVHVIPLLIGKVPQDPNGPIQGSFMDIMSVGVELFTTGMLVAVLFYVAGKMFEEITE